MNIVPIKSNLKKILEEKQMTPYRLAQDWNKHTNHIYEMVAREYWPDQTRLITLVELAGLLNVPIDRLFEVEV